MVDRKCWSRNCYGKDDVCWLPSGVTTRQKEVPPRRRRRVRPLPPFAPPPPARPPLPIPSGCPLQPEHPNTIKQAGPGVASHGRWECHGWFARPVRMLWLFRMARATLSGCVARTVCSRVGEGGAAASGLRTARADWCPGIRARPGLSLPPTFHRNRTTRPTTIRQEQK